MGYLEGVKVGRERAGGVFGGFRLGLGSVAVDQLASHGGHGGAHKVHTDQGPGDEKQQANDNCVIHGHSRFLLLGLTPCASGRARRRSPFCVLRCLPQPFGFGWPP